MDYKKITPSNIQETPWLLPTSSGEQERGSIYIPAQQPTLDGSSSSTERKVRSIVGTAMEDNQTSWDTIEDAIGVDEAEQPDQWRDEFQGIEIELQDLGNSSVLIADRLLHATASGNMEKLEMVLPLCRTLRREDPKAFLKVLLAENEKGENCLAIALKSCMFGGEILAAILPLYHTVPCLYLTRELNKPFKLIKEPPLRLEIIKQVIAIITKPESAFSLSYIEELLKCIKNINAQFEEAGNASVEQLEAESLSTSRDYLLDLTKKNNSQLREAGNALVEELQKYISSMTSPVRSKL